MPSRRSSLCLVTCLATSIVMPTATGCPAPPVDPPPTGNDVSLAGAPLADAVEVEIGPGGGAVEVDIDGIAVTLDVPSDALAADTTIGLQPIALEDLPGAVAVRFTPDGLVFELPALLTFEPAPPGTLLGLAFEEDDDVAAPIFPVQLETGVALPIAHFSAAAVAERDAALSALSPEDRALVLDVEEAGEDAAQALGDQMRSTIEPAVAQADGSVRKLERADELLRAWEANIQVANAEDLTTTIRGDETLRAARERIIGDLQEKIALLFPSYQRPQCNDVGAEVTDVSDWARLALRVVVVAQRRDVTLDNTSPCATTLLTIDGDPTLAPSDPNVSIDARFEIVGPDGERVLGEDVEFRFSVEGATGPATIPDVDGVVEAVRFTRPTSDPRPRAVVITANASTPDIQLGALPAPAPAVFVASEPVAASAVAEPAALSEPGTSEVCVRPTASGAPVVGFEGTVALMGPGALSAAASFSESGEVFCTTYTSPDPLPVEPANAVVLFTVSIDGAPATASATVRLGGDAYAGTVTTSSSCNSTAPFSKVRVCAGEIRECLGEGSTSLDRTATLRIENIGATVPSVTVTSYIVNSESTNSLCPGNVNTHRVTTQSAPTSATAERESNGDITVTVCITDTTTIETATGAPGDACPPEIETTTSTSEFCVPGLLLRPEPAGASPPERFVAVAVPIDGCELPVVNSAGALLPE